MKFRHILDGLCPQRQRSRSPRSPGGRRGRGPPCLCVIVGGPGSGKTALGAALEAQLPGLSHVSSGDLTRSVVAEAEGRSPLLNSIVKQLGDRRRRKLGGKRLAMVMTAVLADGIQANRGIDGIVVDGLRVADLADLEDKCDTGITCILRVQCPRDVLLSRLRGRGERDGDDKLGLLDTTDPAGRIEAYFERAAADEIALHSLLGVRYSGVVCDVDGTLPPERVLASAVTALEHAVKASRSRKLLRRRCGQSPARRRVRWSEQVASTAARLDTEFHPDGRRRAPDGS